MRELDKVLDANEKVFWEGKPKFWPFFLGASVWSAVIGIIWMIFMIPFIIFAIIALLSGSLFGLAIFAMPNFWIGIGLIFGVPLYQYLVYSRMYYAITDKRVIIQSGLIGRDFQITDFDQITNAEVNVGLFDKLFGHNSGSILFSTAGAFNSSAPSWGGTRVAAGRMYGLASIDNPYEVFKFFKKVSYDVKSDMEYPNKYRPKTNPGYGTDYEPKGRIFLKGK